MSKSKESNRAYYLANREKLIKKTREYRSLNLERSREWGRKNAYSQGKKCPDCGNPMINTANYCRRCASKYNPKGTESKMWKGIHKAKGYILIYRPDHPRANKRGYISEHLVNWEIYKNTTLPTGWIIHHLNGIKDDNRPCNLAGIPNRKHYLVLDVKAKRIQQLEALLSNQLQIC